VSAAVLVDVKGQTATKNDPIHIVRRADRARPRRRAPEGQRRQHDRDPQGGGPGT
jgi:hypothetical protein